MPQPGNCFLSSLFFKLRILSEVELHAIVRNNTDLCVLFAPRKVDLVFASESELGEGGVCMRG